MWFLPLPPPNKQARLHLGSAICRLWHISIFSSHLSHLVITHHHIMFSIIFQYIFQPWFNGIPGFGSGSVVFTVFTCWSLWEVWPWPVLSLRLSDLLWGFQGSCVKSMTPPTLRLKAEWKDVRSNSPWRITSSLLECVFRCYCLCHCRYFIMCACVCVCVLATVPVCVWAMIQINSTA